MLSLKDAFWERTLSFTFIMMQRFLPSEFGMDPARMEHAMEPGRVPFDEKMIVRKAVEEANIPFTYISANCSAGYFAGNLCQMNRLFPPKDKVQIYGDGNVKGARMDCYQVQNFHLRFSQIEPKN